MPFESMRQNRWAHTRRGTRALGGAKKVKEWERETDYANLPKRAKKKGSRRWSNRKPVKRS